MPSRAKLTTRGISTTTVTTDALPKNASLTNNELDSNFINLRDQTFSIVGDDSSGIDIKAGDTIKFLGSGGATITATGSTITVTAGGGGSGAITFVGDDSTGTAVNTGETLKIAGTSNISTAVSGDTLTITGPNLTSYLTNSPITIVGDDSTGTTLNTGETVKIAGGTGITTAVSGDVLTITATGGGGSTGDLTITGTTISAATTNADITITSTGTGNLNVIMDTVRLGDATVDATITTNGNGGLRLNTDEGNNSGSIYVSAGANGTISISPNGTGKILLDNNYWPNTDGTEGAVLTTNGAGVLSWETIAGELFELVGDDSTGTPIRLDDTFKIAGGTGIDTSVSGDTLTITNTGVPGPAGPSAVGITFVGDDSTGTRIADGETVKIAGAGGITTAMSGDVLTISGSQAQGITFVGDDSTGTRISDNETIKIAGASNISTAVSGDTLTITGPNLTSYVTLTDSQTLTNKTLTTPIISNISNTGTLTLPTSTDTLVGRATTDTLTNKTLTAPVISSITNTGTLTLPTSTDTLVGRATTDTLTNKTLTSPVIAQIVSVGSGNIELAPDNTGDVLLTADTIRVGDSNANATITTNGTGDLILNTNSGTNSNSIVIEDTATGRIQLIPNSTGRIDLGPVADGTATGLVNFPSAITGNSLGPGDARFKGTGRFYSNLAYTPYTATTSQEIISNDYAMLKTDGGSFDSANIRNTAAAHSMIFDLNGGSATATTTNVTATGVRAANNQVWYMNNAGGTKTGLNINVTGNFTNIVAGHGGALTIPRSVGYVNDVGFARNTGDTTTVTEMWAFRDQGISYSGTGTTGTNSIVTDYVAYETGVNAPSSTNTPWAFRVRSTSQNWRSSIGATDLPKRWSTSTTHSSGGAYTVDYQSSGNGFRQVTLTSNITSFTMSNFPTSTNQISEFDIVFIQDGTGGRTISFTPTSTEVFKFRNGTSSLSDSTAAPEVLHAKVFVRYDGTKSIYYWDIDNREYI